MLKVGYIKGHIQTVHKPWKSEVGHVRVPGRPEVLYPVTHIVA